MTATSSMGRQVRRRGRMPDFLLVGHPKCGTWALYDMLRQHPQVFMSPVKEPAYFGLPARAHHAQSGRRRRTVEDYVALFEGARPEQVCGEATTFYLRSPTAAREIADAIPRARIVAILREPATFVRSLHLQRVRVGLEPIVDLRAALASEAGERRYFEYVCYVDQLARYHAILPPEQVEVLAYDDYRRDNLATVRRLFAFLGVDPDAPVEVVERNGATGVRSRMAADLLHRLEIGSGPVSGVLKRGVSAATTSDFRRRALRQVKERALYTPAPPVDEALMEELRERFAPEVRRVSDYLGRDFCALWGYPYG